MKKLFIILISIVLLIIPFSCGITKYVYLPGETKVEYRDTTIYKDSIIYNPVEVVKEIVPVMDTLNLETSLAKATAYVDTTNRMLRGEIKNKKGITTEIHYKDRIVYRDSVVTQSYPVDVEKIVYRHTFFDKLCWLLSSILLIIVCWKIVKLKLKL